MSVKTKTLDAVAHYPSGGSNSSSKFYVGTDNLLQDKKGVVQIDTPRSGQSSAFKHGDILISNIRPYLKKIWYADCEGIHSPDVLCIRANDDYDSKFLYYSLFRDDFFRHMMVGSKGTKMPRGDKDQVMQFIVPDFSPNYQEQVSGLLWTLDQKIKNNHLLNENIINLLELVFQYKFIQVNKSAEEGWKEVELSSIADQSTRTVSPLEGKNYNYYSIPGFDKYGSYTVTDGKDIDSSKLKVLDNDVLVSKLNPKHNRVVFAENCDDQIASTEFVVIRAKNTTIKNLIFVLCRSTHFRKYLEQSATGTSNSHRRVSPEVIFRYKFNYNENAAVEFGAFASPLMETYTHNINEVKELIGIRDWVLPLLMNGQVKVKDAA